MSASDKIGRLKEKVVTLDDQVTRFRRRQREMEKVLLESLEYCVCKNFGGPKGDNGWPPCENHRRIRELLTPDEDVL